MEVLALSSVVETAIADEAGTKHLTGNITSFDKVFSDDGLSSLERAFTGTFGYLAFFPGADRAVTDYVKAGTLSSDSGPNCLVMFSLDQSARWPMPLPGGAFESWLTLDAGEHPSYRFMRALFSTGEKAPLPSLALFASWTQAGDALAVQLDDLQSEGQIRSRLRTVFAIVESTAAEPDRDKRIDTTAIQLAREKIPYVRAAGPSVRERLWSAAHFAAEHFDQIVAVVGLAI